MRNAKMTEQQISVQLKRKLTASLPADYLVHTGKSLLYKLEVDPLGRLIPGDISSPTRGQYAFQTDILIEQRTPAIPLVVIELKYQGFTTHDIITYSAKASRHKDIYPYLRYGFVVVGSETLSRKFITHNQGVDFAMAIPAIKSGDKELIKLVRRQIRSAEKLIQMMRTNRTKFSRYEETVDIHS